MSIKATQDEVAQRIKASVQEVVGLRISDGTDEPHMVRLRRFESRINDAREKANRARYESGRELLQWRAEEPKLRLQDIAEQLGVDQAELSCRMRFSELGDEALMIAIIRPWRDIRRDLAKLAGRKRKHTKRPVVVKEFSLMVRRVKTALHKVHAKDLTDSDFKMLDVLQEEIARIYDELTEGEKK